MKKLSRLSMIARQTNCNHRKENHGNELVNAVTVSYSTELGKPMILKLTGFDDYWDDEGNPRHPFENNKMSIEFRECRMNIGSAGYAESFTPVKMSNINIEFVPQRKAMVSFQCSFPLSKAQLGPLADQTKSTVDLKIGGGNVDVEDSDEQPDKKQTDITEVATPRAAKKASKKAASKKVTKKASKKVTKKAAKKAAKKASKKASDKAEVVPLKPVSKSSEET